MFDPVLNVYHFPFLPCTFVSNPKLPERFRRGRLESSAIDHPSFSATSARIWKQYVKQVNRNRIEADWPFGKAVVAATSETTPGAVQMYAVRKKLRIIGLGRLSKMEVIKQPQHKSL